MIYNSTTRSTPRDLTSCSSILNRRTRSSLRYAIFCMSAKFTSNNLHKTHNQHQDHKSPISKLGISVRKLSVLRSEGQTYMFEPIIPWSLHNFSSMWLFISLFQSPGSGLTSSFSLVASDNMRISSCTSKLNSGPDFPLALLIMKS